MKQGIKYGFYLGGVLIFLNILYYFINPTLMFITFGKVMLFEIFIYIIFMFLVIAKSSKTIEDSGTIFKIAYLTLIIGIVVSTTFEFSFSHILSEELNPIYLEAKKADESNASDFFGNDPLATLERVELMEDTIEEKMITSEFLMGTGIGLLFLGIPFTILISFLSRQILKYRKKRILLATTEE